MAWEPLPPTVTVTYENPKSLNLDPKKTAVVVVDMQNNFCKEGNQRSFDVIAGNERLLAKARAAGATVIFVQSVRQVDSIEHVKYGLPLHLIVDTWDVEIVEELGPLPGEPVIQKWSHDLWSWGGLSELLRAKGITPDDWTIMVTGVSAATCAHAAALGFSNRLYYTLIPLDCTAADVEQEAWAYSQYQRRGYAYNMDFTLSTLVQFEPAAVSQRAGDLVGAAT
jgi:nicotinamidase-related amidase